MFREVIGGRGNLGGNRGDFGHGVLLEASLERIGCCEGNLQLRPISGLQNVAA